MLTSKIHNLPSYLFFSNFSSPVSCTDLYICILIYFFHIILKCKAYFICAFVFFLRTHFYTTKEHTFSCYAVPNGTCYAIFGEKDKITVSVYARPPKDHIMIKKHGYLYPLDKMNELCSSSLCRKDL